MKNSLRLGRIAGVNVGLHWSLLVIGALLAAGLAGGRLPVDAPGYSRAEYVLAGAAAAVVFLVGVLAHELSHAVVARREGISVAGITLWLLGGVTRMTSEPATPRAELVISGAGPFTSLVLGVVLVAAGIALRAAAISPLLVAVLTWLGVINLVLAVFNALPGTPLDGGRLLHAFVWSRRGDRLHATRIASRAGEILGAILIAIGVIEFALGTAVGGGLWLALLGWFLRTGARVERTHAVAHHALEYATVADVMTRDSLVAPAWASVGEFIDHTALPNRDEMFPVEDRDGTVVGVVSTKRLRRVPRSRRATTRIADVARPLASVPTFGPAEPATALLEHTTLDDDGFALVLDADHLIGTVGRDDLARVMARNSLARN
jgi:Zn-dependent protease/CBS domain-containing protein